jgi:AraC-like DNA-binding protein
LGLEIAHSIIRCVFDLKPVHDRTSDRMEIHRVVEYLHANIAHKITVRVMAGVACMSPSHFSHVFKTEVGKTPMDYLNHIRMERVKKLLLAGDKSITEIALECGFSSPAYLSASFYKKFKITPSAFQQTAKDSSISKKYRRISKA